MKSKRVKMTVGEYLSEMDNFILRYDPRWVQFEISFMYPHMLFGGRTGGSWYIKPGKLEAGLMKEFNFDENRYPNKKDAKALDEAFEIDY